MGTIVIHDLVRVTDMGSLRATFSVEFGGVVYPDFRVVQQEGKKAWVSAPVEIVDGQYKTRNPLPEQTWNWVRTTVLENWNRDSIGSTVLTES